MKETAGEFDQREQKLIVNFASIFGTTALCDTVILFFISIIKGRWVPVLELA